MRGVVRSRNGGGSASSCSRRSSHSRNTQSRHPEHHHLLSAVDSQTEDDPMVGPPPMEVSMVCMTVVMDGPSIAFACYDEERNEIILEAAHTTDDMETVVERFLQTTRPNLVLIGNKIMNNPSFLEIITRPPPPLPDDPPTTVAVPTAVTPDDGTTMRPSTTTLPYRLLKTSAFEIRACQAVILGKLRITTLLRQKVREHGVGFDDPSRHARSFPQAATGTVSYAPSSYHSIAGVVDFDSKVQIQALGALISFLRSSIFRLEDDGMVTVRRIIQAKSSNVMNINAATFAALHIFSTEHHPLIAKGPGNAKEGFSLFSFLDRTQSKGGRKLLREWMMKPLVELNSIQERQDAVELFLQPHLQTTTGVLLSLLHRIGAVDEILTRMQKCASQSMDFIVLTKTLGAAIAIGNTVRNSILPELARTNDKRKQLLVNIMERCDIEILAQIQQEIVDVVDDQLTAESKNEVVIRRGFHEELDDMKDQYERLAHTMTEVGDSIQRKHPDLDLTVVFVSQVGFLVSLSRALVMSSAIQLPGHFAHIFNQDEEAYFKTPEMRALDEDVGDLYGLIRDMESMIVSDLEEGILESETELRDTFKALSELDCILAFASCAFDNNFCRPRMVEASENCIRIKGGRHPLQEIITAREFVPNDVYVDQQERVNVITGPNFSGKSCYLRQVGVLVYMAHLGSFLPCQQAEISIVDQIFAHISRVETCSVPQSSFQLDLTHMASILLRCTSRSLVLIDEFGKGTSPSSGLSILGAAIKKLATIGCKAVCTTHFLELFSMNVIEDRSHGIRARQMAILVPQGNHETASPSFKLVDGVASSSAGLICAKKAGVPPAIIDRAKEIIHAVRTRKTIHPVTDARPAHVKPNPSEVHVLRNFLSVENWTTASDDILRDLLQRIAHSDE